MVLIQWPAISAIAGATSSIVALLTLLRASGLENERIKDRAAESLASYYKALLTKPLSREADKLAKLAQTRAKSALEGLRAAGQDGTVRDRIVAEAVESIRAGFLSLYHELRVATGPWSDENLKESLYRETGDWEDQIQPAIAGLAHGVTFETIARGCTVYRLAVRKLLLESDPLVVRDRERREAMEAPWLIRFVKGL